MKTISLNELLSNEDDEAKKEQEDVKDLLFPSPLNDEDNLMNDLFKDT